MKRTRSLVALSLVAGALMCSSAQAAPVTVGQLFAPDESCPAGTVLQTGVASGNSYTVPVSGLITSWSFQDGSTPVTDLRLKVASPAGGNRYTIVGESAASTQNTNDITTYPASIPVQAGDIIGIYGDGGDCGSMTGALGDTYAFLTADQAMGTTTSYMSASGVRFPVSVTVVPPPAITSVSPTSGFIKGGTSVTITGHDFTDASSVHFGDKPATSFTVNSDTQITAVLPAVATRRAVDVRVTNVAGTSPLVTGDKFIYTACVVPKLKGKTRKKANKALKAADCKLGKVRPKHHKKGHVKKQTPKRGTVLAPGSKVSIKLK